MLILKTRFYIIWMLPFFWIWYLFGKKIFTLTSMADWLEYFERKQPQVGKKPQRLDYPGMFGSSLCSQRLGAKGRPCRPRTLLGFEALSLYPQEPNPSGLVNNCKWGCFFPIAVKKKCTVYIINCFAKISENSEIKLLAINSINIVVNWPGSISCAKV